MALKNVGPDKQEDQLDGECRLSDSAVYTGELKAEQHG